MPEYDLPLRIPNGASGFDDGSIKSAGALLRSRGPRFAAVLQSIGAGQEIAEDDRAFFLELAAAARHIMVINQRPPVGWRPHRAPFGD